MTLFNEDNPVIRSMADRNNSRFARSSTSQLSPERRESLTEKFFGSERARQERNQRQETGLNFIEKTLAFSAAVPLDLLDTVASSVSDITDATLGIDFADRGDVFRTAEKLGPVGQALNDFYTANEGLVEITSGVAGAILTGYFASAKVLPAIGNALTRSSAVTGSSLFQRGAALNAATRAAVETKNLELAHKGAMLGGVLSAEGAAFTGLQIAKTTGTLFAEEAAILTLMHTNDLIWDPEDIASNLFFSLVVPTALGVGIGGLSARRALRGMANDPVVKSIRAQAQDTVGITLAVENNLPIASRNLAKSTVENRAGLSPKITRHALGATVQVPDNTAGLSSLVDATRVGERENLKLSLQKAGFDGPQTRLWVESRLRDDPLALHGLETIIPKNGEKAVAKLRNKLADVNATIAKANPLSAQFKEMEVTAEALKSKLERTAVNIEGLWLNLSEAEDLIKVAARRPIIINNLEGGESGAVNVILSNGKPSQVSFSGTGLRPKIIEKLDTRDRLAVVDGFKEVSKDLIKRGKTLQLRDPENLHWLEIDAAIFHATRGGKITLPSSIKDISELEAISLRKKGDELAKLAKTDPARPVLAEAADFIHFNLPAPSFSERVSGELGETTKSLLDAARKGSTTNELRQLKQSLQKIAGFSKQQETTTPLLGNLFDIREALDDPARAPVFAIIDSGGFSQQDRIIESVTERLIEDRLAALSILTAPQKGTAQSFVKVLTESIIATDDFVQASRVSGLADDQVTGLGNAINQIAGETRTQEFRARDNPAMLGLIRTAERMTRATDNFVSDLFKRHMADVTEKLSGPGSRISRQLLNTFHTYSRGWNISDAIPIAKANGDGSNFGFILEATESNAKRLGTTADEMKKAIDAERPFLLKNPNTNADLILDADALDWQLRFNKMSTELLQETNRARNALNIKPLNQRLWYVPPAPTKDKFVGFTFDANNNVIPNKGIIAETQTDFNRQKGLIEKELGGTVRIRTKEQAQWYLDTFDEAEMGWVDPARLTSPVVRQSGGLSPALIQQQSIQDSLDWAKDRGEALGRSVLRALFDEQIRTARLRHDVVSTISGRGKESRTIYQEYEATARGIPLSTLESSISGRNVRALTETGQQLIDTVWPALEHFTPRAAIRFAQDATQRMGVPEATVNKIFRKGATYQSIADELGPFSPYKNFTDFLEQQHQISQPPQIRGITRSLNALSGALILRYADIHQAGMNLFGLITTLPPIVRAGGSSISNFGTGKRVKIADTMRILTGALGDMVNPATSRDWEIMRANGDTSQSILDFTTLMSQVRDRSSFERVFLGKGTSNATTRVGRLFEKRGIDGLLGVATDSTENFSRAYAHFVGLRTARLLGHTDEASAHQFARELANQGIANYSIVNRPEVFQSAFGSLLGLFTSWSRTYNQKLFRWMENGDFARVGEQMAIQTALFGVSSNAGFNALSGLFDSTVGTRDSEGQEVPTLVDRIYSRLGPEAGSAVSHGGIAALTGIALWTRGDTNIRAPSLDPLRVAPALGILGKLGTIIGDTVVSGADADLMSESLSRNLPNRALRGIWTELVEGGTETDAAGRVVTESQSLVDSFARMTGVRSARQQVQAESYFSNQTAIRNDALRLTPLRQKTRSLLRNNKLTAEKFQEVFNAYLQAGGNAANFTGWIQSQIRETASPRDIRQLQRALNNPSTQLRVLRQDNISRNF